MGGWVGLGPGNVPPSGSLSDLCLSTTWAWCSSTCAHDVGGSNALAPAPEACPEPLAAAYSAEGPHVCMAEEASDGEDGDADAPNTARADLEKSYGRARLVRLCCPPPPAARLLGCGYEWGGSNTPPPPLPIFPEICWSRLFFRNRRNFPSRSVVVGCGWEGPTASLTKPYQTPLGGWLMPGCGGVDASGRRPTRRPAGSTLFVEDVGFEDSFVRCRGRFSLAVSFRPILSLSISLLSG